MAVISLYAEGCWHGLGGLASSLMEVIVAGRSTKYHETSSRYSGKVPVSPQTVKGRRIYDVLEELNDEWIDPFRNAVRKQCVSAKVGYILMQAMMCCPYMSQASGEG